MKKDAPTYEIEYNKGEAYIDIPEEEINEFIKKRLIQIANNPRLLEKYRHGIEDLLEKDLQEYANKQFYEEGKGEVLDSRYGDYELNYEDLTITQWVLTSPAVYYPNDYAHPDEYDDYEIDIDWSYYLDSDQVFDYFYENSEKYEELKDLSEDDLEAYINEHMDELFEKYEEDLKEEYKERAREDAEENYEPPEPDYPDPDDYYDDD